MLQRWAPAFVTATLPSSRACQNKTTIQFNLNKIASVCWKAPDQPRCLVQLAISESSDLSARCDRKQAKFCCTCQQLKERIKTSKKLPEWLWWTLTAIRQNHIFACYSPLTTSSRQKTQINSSCFGFCKWSRNGLLAFTNEQKTVLVTTRVRVASQLAPYENKGKTIILLVTKESVSTDGNNRMRKLSPKSLNSKRGPLWYLNI